jgi:arginyl-tRNA synthetase
MKEQLIKQLAQTTKRLGISADSFDLEYPENPEHGDYSSNIAMAHAKALKMSPKVLAEKIVDEFKKDMPACVELVSVAGPGFINFKIKDDVFAEQIVKGDRAQGSSLKVQGEKRKVMVEYTDPNPFKVFHIGHLMANAIGESISRLIEHEGSEVVRACYQGDVGLHVAKTIWGIKNDPKIDFEALKTKDIVAKLNILGMAYVIGSAKYEEETFRDPLFNDVAPDKTHAQVKKEIDDINKKVFESSSHKKSNPEIDEIYELGRKWSLEYFDIIYKRLGTKFSTFFFESVVADDGIKIVRDSLAKGIFTESDGAVVFKGEEYGLHTRVFITSQGLPTYEAKELGLNTDKFKKYPDLDQSIIVTANEQSDYFKVVLKAFSLINPEIYHKTKHVSHGLLRFASGKMSSRKGHVISAENLINEIKVLVIERIKDRGFAADEIEEVSDIIAIGAIKYTILRQAIGSDIVFDSAKSISFEGDSGPYLQYSVVRANSIIEKAKKENIDSKIIMPEKVGLLEKLIVRFPDVVERASLELAPQHVANYLINLAGAFNSFYAGNTIVSVDEPLSPYRIALTKSFIATMSEGLHILGIRIPKRM